MYKQCDAAGDVRMQIGTVDESGLPTNNILAETTLPASEFPTDAYPRVGDLVTVTFSNPAQVEAGQKYAFIFRLESPNDNCPGSPSGGANGPYFQPLKGDVYSGGTYAYFPDFIGHPHAGQWGLSTDLDHVFAIYVTTDDRTPPEVDEVSPVDGAQGVERGIKEVTANFSEAVQASTLTSSTVQLFSGKSTKPIKATLSVDPPTDEPTSVTLTPSSKLDAKTRYTAKIKGGANGVKDLADNPLDQNPNTPEDEDMVWSFTTAAR
jgi:hypothetical protein